LPAASRWRKIARGVRFVPSVALALDDVGLAVPLQELLERGGHSVLWSPPLAEGPERLPRGHKVDVVVLAERAGGGFERGIEKWRQVEPPPGVLAVVIGKAGEAAAKKARVPLVASTATPAEIAGAVDRALALRWSGKLAGPQARGALGLGAAVADPVEDAARVVKAARAADLDVVREALRWYASHYVSTTDVIAQLRDVRALAIPEVELVRGIDGARTMQTILNKAAIGAQAAGRLIWALACVGAVQLHPEPVDLASPERRAVAMARLHLKARAARSERATHYDVLEIPPASGVTEIEQASQALAVRYAPERMEKLDLGDAAGLVAPIWKAIQRARAILSDPADRLRYNEALSAQRGKVQSTWTFGPNDRARAEEAFARGQRALVAGEPFKAVSEMAAAARAHADHPDYEASLAWARYRADLARGKPKEQIVDVERRAAEQALVGRRPWPRALVALALLCAADEDPDAARWHLKEALACDPNLPVAKQLLTRLGAGRPA
jgi:hypothetical protein